MQKSWKKLKKLTEQGGSFGHLDLVAGSDDCRRGSKTNIILSNVSGWATLPILDWLGGILGFFGRAGGRGEGGGNFGNFGRSKRKTWVFEPVQIWSARLGFYTFWKNTPSDPSTPHEPHLGFLPDLFLPPFQTMSTHLGFQTFSKQWVFRPCQTLSASFGFSYVFKNKVFRLFRLLSAPFGLCTLPKKKDSGTFQTLSAPCGSYSMSKKISFWFLPNRMNSMWILLRFGNMDFRKFPKNLSPSRISYVFPKMISWIVPKFISPTQDFVVFRLECVFRDLGGVKR